MYVTTHPDLPVLTPCFDGAYPMGSREAGFYRHPLRGDACNWLDAAAGAEPALGHGLTSSAALSRCHGRRYIRKRYRDVQL